MLFLLGIQLVLVQLGNAKVLVLDLIFFLFEELHYHLVDNLLHPCKCVQLHLFCQGGQARIVQLLGDSQQKLGCRSSALRVRGPLSLKQGRVECLCEHVMSIIRAEDRQRLGHCFHLKLTRLLPRLPFGIRHCALLLEHHQKLLVSRERVLGVLDVFFGLGILLVSCGLLRALLVDGIAARSDLCLLCRLQILICLLARHLFLLRGRQVGLKGFLHLFKDAKDLP
mmetsp:Transcript_112246/g.206015  ORF Transcript_112246/g.206015 Transcript_112246/m.206015 type:complete len:225 (-) Transcript_112246:802-1476(-)